MTLGSFISEVAGVAGIDRPSVFIFFLTSCGSLIGQVSHRVESVKLTGSESCLLALVQRCNSANTVAYIGHPVN